MSSPPSLRDLYTDPSSAWAFVPPPAAAPANPSGPLPPTPSPASFHWSARTATNSIFDLSPDLNETGGFNAVELLRALAASAVLQYTSSAIAMPLEVGKTLLQVQWIPREPHDYDLDADTEDDDDALSDSSNENEAYFADPEGTPRVHHPPNADDHGRKFLQEEAEFVIPVGSANGVWGMIKRVGRFRGEGWLALWKGLLTSCVSDVLSTTLQPMVHNLLLGIFFPSTPLFHQPPLLLSAISHVFTAFVLSPLDLVRTRLIVQSSIPRYRSYTGPIDALSQITRDEGGLKGLYLHPQLLIPTIIDTTLRTVVSLAAPAFLASYIGANITESSNPLLWGLTEFAGSCLGLLITLPFETIRRRLQVQTRGAPPINGIVQLRPAPYNGVVDAFWHILTEERSDLPIIRRTRKRRSSTSTEVPPEREGDSWLRHTGLGQLYRGFGMRLGASAIVFLLVAISGGDSSDGGWAEL